MLARLGASLVTILIVAGCVGSTSPLLPSQSAGPSTSPSALPTTPSSLPATSPAASPSPTAVSPSPLGSLAWHSLGTIPATNIVGVVGYAKGYLAVGSTRKVWSSPDGRTWKAVTLPFEVAKDKSGNRLEADVWAVTTDGTRVLVVGGYAHAPCASVPPGGMDTGGGGPGCPLAPLSWISADGVSWASDFPGPRPTDPPGYRQGSEFVAAWPVPTGGWDAALSYWQGESLTGRDLMHSTDGLRWAPLAPLPAADVATDYPPFAHAGAADAAGRCVTWADWLTHETGTDNPQIRFVSTAATSLDGRSWTAVDGFPGENAHVLLGLAPVDGGPRWVLAGSSGAADGWTATSPTIWSSADAATWTRISLPAAAPVTDVTGLIHSAVGYVAVSGYRYGKWHTGDPGVHETWLSADGVTWMEQPVSGAPGADHGPGFVADGPAGVIGIGPTPDDRGSTVWQLR